MKRLPALLALVSLLAALASCNRHKSVDGLWRLDRQRSNMPMGFNLRGQSYLRIEVSGDSVDLHDFVIAEDGSKYPLLDRHYTLDGKEFEESSYGDRTLYISARFEGTTLHTEERIVDKDPNAQSPETRTSVTYVLSGDGEEMIGTNEGGRVATYARQ